MFLFQKLKYNVIELIEPTKIKFEDDLIAFDTETTGLDEIISMPFLFVAGSGKTLYYWVDPKFCLDYTFHAYAHSAKYDWHMMQNIGINMPNLQDSKFIARLTEYADSLDGLSLETLGKKYVDDNSKFAGSVIKKHLKEINARRLKEAKNKVKEKFKTLPLTLTKLFEAHKKRVQFVEHEYDEIFDFIDSVYSFPNYKDVYEEYPDLMISYALDDVVILLEYLKRALEVIKKVYGENQALISQEQKLIEVTGMMEREGFKANVDYLLESRERIINYRLELQTKLDAIVSKTYTPFSVGQHKEIKNYYQKVHNINMDSTDVEALENLIDTTTNDANEVASLILELRTIEKYLSTYVEGMLNRVHNGMIYPSIDNAGTVTGRVSSDLQQQPKNALLDASGNELFHPRRVFTNKRGSKMYFFDYSQMEMRLQAHYTLLIGDGDLNLCRAFMPYKCNSIIDNREFVFKQDEIDSGEWVDEDYNLWKPVDLHTVTTLKAFPELSIDDPNFSTYRRLGKMCNFLKNYGGGFLALKQSLKVSDDIANSLNKGYYEAFPKILHYQKWVESQLLSQGFVENLYGRKYFVSSSLNYYKAYNYVIQGSCADFFKQKQILLYNLLKDKKSKAIMVIHDEIVVSIDDSEEYLVPIIKKTLDDYTLLIPMLAGIDVTNTDWASKVEVVK